MRAFGQHASVVLVCALLHQATPFRIQGGDVTDSAPSQPLSNGRRVMIEIDGSIDVANNPDFKILGGGDKVKYDVATQYGWFLGVNPASVTVTGRAAWGSKDINPHQLPVSVQFTGHVTEFMPNGQCVFQREDGNEMLLIPETKVRALPSEAGIDYKVTKVTRGGKHVFIGNASLFYPVTSLGKEAINKEYMIQEIIEHGSSKVITDFPFLVKGEGYCGTELFTTEEMICDLSDSLQKDVNSVTALAPTNDRGFGLEFELVAHEVPREIEVAANASFKERSLPDTVEQFSDEHAMNYNDPQEYKDVVRGIQLVNYCFRSSFNFQAADGCTEHYQCNPSEYCTSSGTCRKRSDCKSLISIDGECPMDLGRWVWESDVSVQLLSTDEVMAIPGATHNEMNGIGMEIVSPPPPHVLSGLAGMRSTAELLGVLNRQGVQAGPSQGLHVHVNAVSPDAPGSRLSIKGIASVWVAWAKYQLVIDEMLSPGRPDNEWAGRLIFASGEPWQRQEPDDCRNDFAYCVAIFFRNMHKRIESSHTADTDSINEPAKSPESTLSFCNDMFRLENAHPQIRDEPCKQRYPHQRYFQVNLMPLTRFGTIEFRPHSATVKVERIARWVQFLTAFVEHFGNTAEGLASTKEFFDTGVSTWETDFAKLRDAQRSATLEQLFVELGPAVDKDSLAFYADRKWEDGDTICSEQKAMLLNNEQGFSLSELKSASTSKKSTPGSKRSVPVERIIPMPEII